VVVSVSEVHSRLDQEPIGLPSRYSEATMKTVLKRRTAVGMLNNRPIRRHVDRCKPGVVLLIVANRLAECLPRECPISAPLPWSPIRGGKRLGETPCRQVLRPAHESRL